MEVTHRYLEKKPEGIPSLKLLECIKTLQEWRVGVVPSLKSSLIIYYLVFKFVYKREKQYREEPVIDGEAQIVIVQFHKSRPRIFII